LISGRTKELSIEGAFEVKKKITTDIKAALTLIRAENTLALKNVIGTIVKSASKSMGVKRGSIFSGNKRKKTSSSKT
jgi:hypothetical protein